MGLAGASSIEDKTIPTFSRGELPHFAGINTFMKAPYVENVRDVAGYDATVVGVPFDGGCTYRAGTRFGPQGIRRISALYTPYNYERGIDLREQMSLCDAGDVFTIPANIEKSFDQISNAVAHIASTGSMPIILGGDHSIGFPTVRGLASVTSKNIGIIHVDRHADIQEKDLDERMHTTPYFHATNLPNVKPKNLVQIGIGGWQVPRPAVPNMVERETNIFTMDDVEEYGIEKIAEMALDRAWDGCDAVYMSYDIDSIEAAFVPGTGWYVLLLLHSDHMTIGVTSLLLQLLNHAFTHCPLFFLFIPITGRSQVVSCLVRLSNWWASWPPKVSAAWKLSKSVLRTIMRTLRPSWPCVSLWTLWAPW